MVSEIDLSALGQALDTTWGRSSTPKTASYSVKFTITGSNMICASYAAIVNFASERQMVEMKRMYSSESVSIINEHLKLIKSSYKKLTGKTLKTKQETSSDCLEVIGVNFYNPRRTAYYRRKTFFEVV